MLFPKAHILSVILCLVGNLCWSQTPNYQDFINLLSTDDSEKAISVGTELMQIYEEKGNLDTAYTNVAANVAYLYYATNAPQSAVEIGEKCQSAMMDMGDTMTADFAEIVYYNAIYSSYTEDFAGACAHLEHVLKIKTYLNILDDENEMSIRWQMANMYAGIQANAEAESNYKWIESYAKNNWDPLDSMSLVVSNTMASFYFTNGRFEEAEPYYVNACDLMKTSFGAASQMYVLSLNSLGEFYIYAGNDEAAYNTFKETSRLSKKVFGESTADHATALNNLAVAADNLTRYDEAIKLYEKVLEIKESVYKTESDYYALSVMNLGAVYEKVGAFDQAKIWLEKAIQIYEDLDLDEGAQTNYSVTLSHYSTVLAGLNEYDAAKKIDLKAIDLQEKAYGKRQAGYCNAVQRYGMNLITYAEYGEAKKVLENCLSCQAEVLGEQHPNRATTMLYLSQVCSELNDIKESYKLVNQALPIIENTSGRNSREYTRALNTLANIQFQDLNYADCRKTYQTSLKLAKNAFGTNHLERATILNNYGLFNIAIGDYDNAEKYLQLALKIQKHPDNANLLASDLLFTYVNLANNYMAIGDYGLAEKHLQEAHEIAKEKLPKNHPDLARVLDNRAKVYAEIGLIDQATELYDQAIVIHSEIYGENSTAVAGVLNNKASAFLFAAQMEEDNVDNIIDYARKSIVLLQKSIQIGKGQARERDLSAEYNNLAESYRVLGAWDSAFHYYDLSIEEERRLGKDVSSVAVTLHNKAMTYLAAGQPQTALDMANEGIKLREDKFGKNHFSLQTAYLSKGQILVFLNRHEEAHKEHSRVMEIYTKELERNFSYFSEKEKLNWLKSNNASLTAFRRFAYSYRHRHPQFFAKLVRLELQLSAMLLRSNDRLKVSLQRSGDETMLQKYQAWQDSKKQLSRLINEGLSESSETYKSLESEIRSNEKELSEELGENSLYLADLDQYFIQEKLKSNEKYIQFISFVPNDTTANKAYYALVYSSGKKLPEFVQLFSENQFTDLIDKTASTRKKGIDKLYGNNGRLNFSLGQFVLDSLKNHLSGADKVYFTPSGILHKIAFSALSVDGRHYVSDSIKFQEIVDPLAHFSGTAPTEKLQVFELIGGVNYGDENGDWAYLEGTRQEVEKIHEIIKAHQLKDELLLDVSATEESLKNALMRKKPDVLHLASHGFFYPDPEEMVQNTEEITEDVVFRGSSSQMYSQSADPMKRSGLVLAGANSNENDGEDGILSAYEISLLDLSETNLTVLSACETGLGDVSGSEGVFGLQRAFMMAGVDNMILSLWQVPDKETSEFMVAFYENLCNGDSIEDAFTKVQKEMRQKYDPYFWAAFVLVR